MNPKKVAIYNGFTFHYEMMGYLIHYFLLVKSEIVIYCNLYESLEYIDLFRSLFGKDSQDYRSTSLFDAEKAQYDTIILLTDDDMSFSTEDPKINERTIRIDHDLFIRRPEINRCIATRPFFNGVVRPWAIPCYPAINFNDRMSIECTDNTHIMIVNNDIYYHSTLINRLVSDKPIVIHAVSRDMDISRFSNIRDDITIQIYKNIGAFDLFKIAVNCNFIFTDVSINPDYENKKMSGAIPISFSVLTPLIISKQTNSHYKFNNVIEFDKYEREPIMLPDSSSDFFHKLEDERADLIEDFFRIMHFYL